MSKKLNLAGRHTSRLQALNNGLIRRVRYRGHFGNMTVARYFVEEIRHQ